MLRALPKLQKLDNVEVTPEEVTEAIRTPIPQQTQKQEAYEEQYESNNYQSPPPQQQQTAPPPQQYRSSSPIREVIIDRYYV